MFKKRRSSRKTVSQVAELEVKVKDLEVKLEKANERCRKLEATVEGLGKEADQSKNALLSSLKGVLATCLIESHVWDEIDELFAKRVFCQPLEITVVAPEQPAHRPKLPTDPSFHLQLEDVDSSRCSISSRPSAVNPDIVTGDTLRSIYEAESPPATVPDKKSLARASEKILPGVDMLSPEDAVGRRRLLGDKNQFSLVSAGKSPRGPEGKAASPELQYVVVKRKSSNSPTGTERKATDDSNLEVPSKKGNCSVAEEEADKKFLSTSPPDQLILTQKFDSSRSIIIHDEHGSSRSLAELRDRKLSNTSSTGGDTMRSNLTSPSLKDLSGLPSGNPTVSGQLSSGPSVIDLGLSGTTTRSVVLLDGASSGNTGGSKGGTMSNRSSLGSRPSGARSSMEASGRLRVSRGSSANKEKLKSPRSPLGALLQNHFTISENNEVEGEVLLDELPLSPFKADNSSMFAPMFASTTEDKANTGGKKKKRVTFGASTHMRADTWAPGTHNAPMFSPSVQSTEDSDSDQGGFGGGSLFERLNTARITATTSIQNDAGLKSSIKRQLTARKLEAKMYDPFAAPPAEYGLQIGNRTKPIHSAPNSARKKRGRSLSPNPKPKASSFSSKFSKAPAGRKKKSAASKPARKPAPAKRAQSLESPAPLKTSTTVRKSAAERKAERLAKRNARQQKLAPGKKPHQRSKSAQSWSPYG